MKAIDTAATARPGADTTGAQTTGYAGMMSIGQQAFTGPAQARASFSSSTTTG
ncbi:hypothetical protein ACIGMX_05530 [Streptomyces aquilus]|uniref:hypothetical protein n=1 Tax=Streptomyces aquilus TaxID=2548456 RepID=UPI0037D01283